MILKLYEGVGAALVKKIKKGMMSSMRSKIGALLVKPALKATLKDFDSSEHGGAPLLGLNGLVVKTHGSSTSKEICNSIIQCPVSYTHLDVYKRQEYSSSFYIFFFYTQHNMKKSTVDACLRDFSCF